MRTGGAKYPIQSLNAAVWVPWNDNVLAARDSVKHESAIFVRLFHCQLFLIHTSFDICFQKSEMLRVMTRGQDVKIEAAEC